MDSQKAKTFTTQKIRTNKTTKLRIAYTNADGILNGNKIDELFSLIDNYDPDIISLTETKLKPTDIIPHIDNYQIFRKDRLTSLGGGVAILIKKI